MSGLTDKGFHPLSVGREKRWKVECKGLGLLHRFEILRILRQG